MPRPNTIDLLPADIRERVNAWLNDISVTQFEAVERTNALVDAINEARPDGEQLPNISKSGLNRYAQRYAKVGERMRQSREAAQVLMAGVQWDDSSEVDRYMQEMVRSLAFDITGQLIDDSEPVSPKMLSQLALTIKRLQEAAAITDKRERAIRDQEREAAAERVEQAARERGLSAEDAKFWRERVLMGV